LIKIIAKLCKQDFELTDCQLDSKEWEQIQEMLQFLQPFAELTTLISGETYPTISNTIVYYNVILDHLDSCKRKALYRRKKHLHVIVQAAALAKEKLIQYYNRTTDIHCVVTLIDPCCKLAYFKKEKFTDELLQPILKR
jgi:hypothetical protein